MFKNIGAFFAQDSIQDSREKKLFVEKGGVVTDLTKCSYIISSDLKNFDSKSPILHVFY
jgi:hypothetical protein